MSLANCATRKRDWPLLLILVLGLVLPYLARIPGIPRHGMDWFLSYLPSLVAVLFFGVFNLIPLAALFLLRIIIPNRSLPFYMATLLSYGFMFWAHATLDLASDAQAAIALFFIPIYASGLVVAGWVIGWVIGLCLQRALPARG